jgi:Fe-S cluster biogenesis protein NfuA
MPKIAEIEYTPNPNARKFVLKEPITNGPSRSYPDAASAADDGLAKALFAVPHVTNVYYVDRYITVTQDGGADWQELLRKVADPIRAAQPIVVQASPDGERKPVAAAPEDQAKLDQIVALLDARVKPALMMDGGGLEVIELSGGILKVHYQGACGTCPSSMYGTLAAIENLVRLVDPSLQVVAV